MGDLNTLIVELRQKTGAGFMDCKKALTEANGKFEEALTILRKKGLADAAKRSARATKEGAIACAVKNGSGAIIELNCETDFVARTPDFQTAAKTLAEKAAEKAIGSPADAQGLLTPLISKLGENMSLRRMERYASNGPALVEGYIHHGGKVGAMIELSVPSTDAAKSEVLSALAKELLLQIVGMSPRYVRREEIPAEVISKEKDIYVEMLRKEGKPEASIPKIVEGKINKLFYQSFCLLDQLSVRDPKTSVSKIIQEASAKLGGPVEVKRFLRYQLGE